MGALCGWTRNVRIGRRAMPVHRITAPEEEDRKESRGHRAARLQKARINHEVRMTKEKAREEIEKEARVGAKRGGGRQAKGWGGERGEGEDLG